MLVQHGFKYNYNNMVNKVFELEIMDAEFKVFNF